MLTNPEFFFWRGGKCIRHTPALTAGVLWDTQLPWYNSLKNHLLEILFIHLPVPTVVLTRLLHNRFLLRGESHLIAASLLTFEVYSAHYPYSRQGLGPYLFHSSVTALRTGPALRCETHPLHRWSVVEILGMYGGRIHPYSLSRINLYIHIYNSFIRRRKR